MDNRNEPELTLEVLKQAAMTCPSVLENPIPIAQATDIKGDRINYTIYLARLRLRPRERRDRN
jgi:small-conductance mechanosensitive channel